MPIYKPLPIPIQKLGNSLLADVGEVVTRFEPLTPDPQYRFVGRIPPTSWGIVKPKTGPPIGDLPELIKNLIKATWKFAEPDASKFDATHARAASHGISIGARGGGVPVGDYKFHQQVRPTKPDIHTTFMNDTAIASDWKVFDWIRRTNAVTFRGDSRSPNTVIKAQGFYPPNSRTDTYYLENNIYPAFEDYFKRRYGRNLSSVDFLDVIDGTAATPSAKSLLVDYMMWRKITERESVHLGRMVESECLKGYISTARSIDTSLHFATGYGQKPGWLYLTVVHSGFVVPGGKEHYWGSAESEIAQWGPIPADRIVGFVHVQQNKIPNGPIFIRRSFRVTEPEAFEHMFKVMSGMTPSPQRGGFFR